MHEGEAYSMGFVNPLIALTVSLCFLLALLYKRVNLGITLNSTAILLALLGLDWQTVPTIIYETAVDQLTVSIVLTTFGIMLLSQLYKETGVINELSESLSRIIRNSKIVISVLPAVIGFLPVAGGALMSAPLVEKEAEKLGLRPEKKAYLNLWFRHTIFPVYPLSQVLIITAALTGTTVPSIILRQIPVVIVMIIVGFIMGFWKLSKIEPEEKPNVTNNLGSDSKIFLIAFSPILATIIVAIGFGISGLGLSQHGFDVLIATLIGLIILMVISRLSFQVFMKPFRSWGIYGIAFAAFGAFLLRNTMIATGISEIFTTMATGGNLDVILLLTLTPAILGFLTGSPSGGVAIGVSILAGILTFSPKIAALIYISAYLGYIMAPTHLCFTFTAVYFKCPLGKVYNSIIPSILVTFATALLIYFLL